MSSNRVGIQDNADSPGGSWERQVLEAVRGIRYGSVEVVIHDARIVQIERREKVRLEVTSRRSPEDRSGGRQL